ncbi:hypothetical protein BC936DRAFT_147811 [Jimgerdemannia flammicorona]|uniref:Uncharacterized protein n=1 Tax=Jimgerdemannia flammicorona TaxID=994334 RepID=A0A433D4E1_9FUNG|nr:hypothetical protein BC936DRAFT_147811 [Jimgerdemannia flammicorona]
MSDVNHNEMGPVGPADTDAIDVRVILTVTFSPLAPSLEFLVFNNVKREIIDKLHEIHHADHVHHLHETDKLKHISAFKVVLYAKEEVAYGWNYFAKIHLGDEKYIHAR